MLETVVFYWTMTLLVVCGTAITGMLVAMALDILREVVADLVYAVRNRGSKR